MPNFFYRTLKQESTGSYREKGSKFLAFAYPVQSEAQIKVYFDRLKREYFDARHHCFAWMLGPEHINFRAFDDGEPNHSAGDPILGQIRSKELTNILIVVVRYFGGVKLGVGGLISAYRSASEDALSHAIIIEEEVFNHLKLQFKYANTADVMRLVSEFNLSILGQQFTEVCTMEARLPLKRESEFIEKVKLLNHLGIPITML